MSQPDVFDANYFKHGCGALPYERNAGWLKFFDGVAAQIVNHIAPPTLLDAGCAMGFLVEGLRDRGVAAFGVDISEYALQNVRADLRPYCWQGSVVEPFPQRYDLIVSIEVLEHLSKTDAEQAVANFCRHTDDVLFSSTPSDYKEVTHFNVQPPDYWAEQFALHGFYRDVDFDASFITPWAVRFRRRSEPPARLVRAYERKFWLLWKENVDLRQLTGEMRQDLSRLQEEVEHLRATYQTLEAETLDLRGQLSAITESASWQLILKLQSGLAKLAPPGSRRSRWLYSVQTSLRRWLGGRS